MLFGNLTLGGDGMIDISHWTLPNVEYAIEYINATIVDRSDRERDIKGINAIR